MWLDTFGDTAIQSLDTKLPPLPPLEEVDLITDPHPPVWLEELRLCAACHRDSNCLLVKAFYCKILCTRHYLFHSVLYENTCTYLEKSLLTGILTVFFRSYDFRHMEISFFFTFILIFGLFLCFLLFLSFLFTIYVRFSLLFFRF